MEGGAIVRTAILVIPEYVAVIVAEVEVETAVVVMVKVALVLPAAKLTEEASDAEDESSDKVTVIPPVGAAAVRVTVP
jgi:hypothetical protein